MVALSFFCYHISWYLFFQSHGHSCDRDRLFADIKPRREKH